MKAKSLDKKFDENKSDILDDLDLPTIQRPNQTQKRANPDIRWQQHFGNYHMALTRLDEAVALTRQRKLSQLENLGLIQTFEFCYELGWNTLRDFLVWQGIEGIIGSRDTIREAFSKNLIDDGQGWMEMLIDRNRTSHTYNEEVAAAILGNILQRYHPLLKALEQTLLPRVVPSP